MGAAFLWLLAVAQYGQNLPPPDADPLPGRTEQLKLFKEKAAEVELRRGPDEPPLALTKEPVLRYSNAEREIGSLDGATFVWLEGARPVAVVSFSVRRQGNSIYRECTSLSSKPLACTSGGALVWMPKTAGLLSQPLADAADPAATKAQRLVQLRALARRFTATCYNSRSDEPTELRLLPQPLYRYEDEKARLLDGAIFAFVVSNDPELLLVLEAVKAEGSPAAWRFSLARMSSLKEVVRLDGKDVWAVANYYRDPGEDRRTGPYVEGRIGTFGPPVESK
jgi:hypothetical protein